MPQKTGQTVLPPASQTLEEIVRRLETGGALLPNSPDNLIEVVGILKSYGEVLNAYRLNLTYIAEYQFLVLFPFFKYFNGEVTASKLLRHWWHDRINYEFSEYCMKAMFWHGGGKLDDYLDSDEFRQLAQKAIQAKLAGNPLMLGCNRLFPEFLLEQVRVMAYYSALGQFWTVMSAMFLDLSDRYDRGEIQSIGDVVDHILVGLVEAASKPIVYQVKIGNQTYDILPASAGLTFLMDTAVPYVEAVFFRSFPFRGTVTYNAQSHQISADQSQFCYGALYADPLPIGGAGIPPTLLMQDMTHFLPEYLHDLYRMGLRGEEDLRVKICISFQKSMFCVTTAAILGLAPYPITTTNPTEQQANHIYLGSWVKRLADSRLITLQND
ncbi:MAG: CO2 hydration protein [Scytolyngbya sp. HA4215-MV1]|jgi:CO2 hydration protein|nr:CO2 hydration protein [Scytolyngbya sp. HA4215-MV1]